MARAGRARVFVWPCGLHQGPKPIPATCVLCERAAAAEKLRPPVKGYGVGERNAVTREKQRAVGALSGQFRTMRSQPQFPRKRVETTAVQLLTVLRKNHKKKV